jgi:hypothetical protein
MRPSPFDPLIQHTAGGIDQYQISTPGKAIACIRKRLGFDGAPDAVSAYDRADLDQIPRFIR